MSKDATTAADLDATQESALIAKLKAYKAEKNGRETTELPSTGVTASWPEFKPHAIWMRAQRLAKDNGRKAMSIYMTLLCKFDGENMTLDEFTDLLPGDDIMHLIEKVMGAAVDDDEEEQGNALH